MQVIFAKLVSIFLSFLLSLNGVSLSVIKYTDGEPICPEEREYKFDRDRLLIGGYYASYDELDYCAGAGIDFIVTGGVDGTYLNKAQSLGVGVIGSYNLPTAYMEFSDALTRQYLDFSPSDYKDHPALWGDNFIDEPNAAYFDNIGAAVADYNSKFTNLPYINLFPQYANDEQLGNKSDIKTFSHIFEPLTDEFSDTTAQYKMHVSDYINKIDTDYICVDIYPMKAKLDLRGNKEKYTYDYWLRNLDILAEACRGTGRDLWVITQAAGLTKDGVNGGDMRWTEDVCDISQQVYASLAFGTRAVIHALFGSAGWWDTDSHMIGSDGKPTPTYFAAAEVDACVKSFAEEYGKYDYTSTYLINPALCAGHKAGKLACEVPEERGNITSTGGVCVGTFVGEGSSKAYIVTNMEELDKEKDVAFSFSLTDGASAQVYRKGETLAFTKSFSLTLDPGEGVFITVDNVPQPTVIC